MCMHKAQQQRQFQNATDSIDGPSDSDLYGIPEPQSPTARNQRRKQTEQEKERCTYALFDSRASNESNTLSKPTGDANAKRIKKPLCVCMHIVHIWGRAYSQSFHMSCSY